MKLIGKTTPRAPVGIKLRGIPTTPLHPRELHGKTIAIDAPNLLYAHYATAYPNRERQAALLAATRGLAQRIQQLAQHGARSIILFDGPPHPLKTETLQTRRATRRMPPIRPDDYAPARATAQALGCPTLNAPHDAEAQATWLAKHGHADLVATTDWDALAMGAPRLLRRLSAHPTQWQHLHLANAHAHLHCDEPTLRTATILMGCDYFDGYPGLGPQRALQLARQSQGDLTTALAQLPRNDAAAERAHQAHHLLQHPPHHDPGTLRWRETDHDAVRRILAGETPAKPRARQTRLDG